MRLLNSNWFDLKFEKRSLSPLFLLYKILPACLLLLASTNAFAARTAATVTVGIQSGTVTYGTAGSVTFLVSLTTSGNGNGSCTPSVSGLPTGVSGSFSPTPVNFSNTTPSPATTLTLTTTAATTQAVTGASFTVTCSVSNTGSLTVNTKALSVTANSSSKNYGTTVTFAGTEFTASGLVNGNTVTSVTLTSSGAAASAAAGSYSIVPSVAVGSGLANYTITYVDGTLTVNNLVPTTSSISPTSKNVGDVGFTMSVNGTNFVSTSVVQFAGSNRTTAYVSATQLTATIPASDLTATGTFNITVVNPAPGGGTSNPQVFAVIPPERFNAFETTTTAGAIAGVIKTKIAGSEFSLDVVAISGGAQASTFTNTVKVELLGNTTTGISLDGNNCPTSFTLLQTVSPNPTITSGRSTVNFAAVSDAWKDVRVRINFPPTVTSCSTDNFAIRPNAFISVSVSDQDWQTAYTIGTPRSLYNTSATGGNVHKAGQPFTLIATAVNAIPATTTNYTGTPSAVLSSCGDTGCTTMFGTFSVGSAAVSGVINSTTASYSEVGAFAMQLQDQAFASVDAGDTAGDCAATGRYVCSTTFNVGRFVPDRFVLATNNIPVFKTFNDTTCTSRSFTYMGQSFGYVTSPQSLVTAQNAAGGTTTNYKGALWKLVATDVTQVYGYTLTPASTPGLDAGLIGAPMVADNNNGTGTVTANSGDLLAFTHSATTPLAPFTAAISLSMSVADSSESGNGVIGAGAPALFSNIAFDSGNVFRYGRLWLANAYGTEKNVLKLRYEAQYWNGSAFVTNLLDNCTSFVAANVGLGNIQGALAMPAVTVNAISGGVGSITLTPSSGVGSADLTVNLGGFLNKCATWTPSPIPVGASPSLLHLRGKWCGTAYDRDPVARATFGIFGSSAKKGPIYLRENY